MWSSNIAIEGKYDYLKDKFKTAYEFLKREDLAELPVGAISLDGNDVVAHIQHYSTVDAKTIKFETHDKFFDIQFVISGKEKFGVVNRSGLIPAGEYNEQNDICFYEEPEVSGSVLLLPGDYVVVAPEDAHKPRCSTGVPTEVKKVVVKVRI